MNQNKLKKITDLLQYGDGKFLVVENDEPAFVVMSIDEYKMIKDRERFFDPSNIDRIDRINRDIESWRDFDEDEESDDDEFDDEGFDPSEFDDIFNDPDFGKKKEDEIIIEELEEKKSEMPKEDIFKADGIEGIPF